MTLKVYDTQGKSIMSKPFKSEEGYNNQPLDLSKFGTGVFLIQLTSQTPYEQFKLIIE